MVTIRKNGSTEEARATRLQSYRIEEEDAVRRIHLREEPDGSGLMIVDASVIVHVNATALAIARAILDGEDVKGAQKRLRRMFRGVKRDQVERDYDKVHSVIFPKRHEEDECPWQDLASGEIEPFAAGVSAPYRADLAITYQCNNDCAHCYVARDKNMKSLRPEEWRLVLDKLWQVGIPHVCFTGGEATTCDFLVELVEYAEDTGFVTGLLTNGRRLSDRAYVETLLGAGLDHVQITLESHKPEVHNEMVGCEGFEETVLGIRNALAGDVFLVTNTTLTTKNAKDIEGTIDFLNDLGVRTFACNAIIYSGGGKTSGIGLSDMELPRILALVAERARRHKMRFIWYSPTRYCRLNPTELDIGYKRCTAGEYNICVEPNGDVIPCQSYYEVAGNILEDPWENIWSGKLFRQFRDRLNADEECRDCPDFDVCGGGCPLERETGVLRCQDGVSES